MGHNYKIAVLDHRNHVVSVDEPRIDTDEQAAERAKATYSELTPYAVEVWDGGRFVCRVNDVGLIFAPPPPRD